MFHTNANKGDKSVARSQLERCASLGLGIHADDFVIADGAYNPFDTYTDVRLATRQVLSCNRLEGARMYGDCDSVRILAEFSFLYDIPGFDPEMMHNMDRVLRFLYKNEKKETIGMYLRNINIRESEEYNEVDTRWRVCESAHRAFKR